MHRAAVHRLGRRRRLRAVRDRGRGLRVPLPEGLDDEHAAPLLVLGDHRLSRAAPESVPEGGVSASTASARPRILRRRSRCSKARPCTSSRGRCAREARASARLRERATTPTTAARAARRRDLVRAGRRPRSGRATHALDRGGTLSIAGIHLSDVPRLVYADELFEERTLTSTTANTAATARICSRSRRAIPLHVTTTPYAFDAADRVLHDLAHDRVTGAAVLRVR